MVEEIGTLGGNGLHVAVLILHNAGHHRIVNIPDLRNTPPCRSVNHALRRRRAFDDVIWPAKEFGDQLAFGGEQRLDEMRRQEAILGDGARIQ